MSLLMLDIDRFKSINDRFGHAAGDHVIVQIAEMCRHERRKSDVVARFGGEEFLLLLPETQLSEAHELAERLRRQIEARDLSVASQAITATVSVGVAQATSSMDTIFDLIKVAANAFTRKKLRSKRCVRALTENCGRLMCLACGQLHLINRLTGKVLGAEDQ